MKLADFLKRHGKKLLGLLMVIILANAGAVVYLFKWMNDEGDNSDFAVQVPRLIEIKPGMTTFDVASLLHEKQLVKNPLNFRIEAKLSKQETQLQTGIYQINGGLSNREILNILVQGQIMLLQFVVPEGYNVNRIAQKLEAEGLCTAEKFREAAKEFAPFEYMQTDNPDVIYKAEGFIFPATYDFPVGLNEKEILGRMVEQFDSEMHSSGVLARTRELGIKLSDVVNMAAMVELEAAYQEEQPVIAGVFARRLQLGMPIQSDTTIQYILGFQKELVTFADTRIQNPYNTYQNPGLPPGPIASPGLSAIKASLTPEDTDYLYFVAEKDGHHRFSKSYREHLRAIDDIG